MSTTPLAFKSAVLAPDEAADLVIAEAESIVAGAAAFEGDGIVTAIVSVTGVVDEVDDIIEPGAYAETLRKRLPKVCWHHSWEHPIGKVLWIEELMPGDPRLPAKTRDGQPWPAEAGALVAKMQMNMDSERGREAYSAIKFYSESGECEYSIGYKVPQGKSTRDAKGIRHIKVMDLFELSFVLFGAHTMTGTLALKAAVSLMHKAAAGHVTLSKKAIDEEFERLMADVDLDDVEDLTGGEDDVEDDEDELEPEPSEPTAVGPDDQGVLDIGDDEDDLEDAMDTAEPDDDEDEAAMHRAALDDPEFDVALDGKAFYVTDVWGPEGKAEGGADRNRGGAEHLRRWYLAGADGQIAWNTDGDFDQCVAVASKHMDPERAKGYCANRHKDATGQWPGAGRDHSGGKGLLVPLAGQGVVLAPTGTAVALSAPERGDLALLVSPAAKHLANQRPANVLRVGDRFQVMGADAVPLTAEVVDLQTIGDRAVGQLVGQVVSGNVLSAETVDAAVAVTSNGASPEQARSKIRAMFGDAALDGPGGKSARSTFDCAAVLVRDRAHHVGVLTVTEEPVTVAGAKSVDAARLAAAFDAAQSDRTLSAKGAASSGVAMPLPAAVVAVAKATSNDRTSVASVYHAAVPTLSTHAGKGIATALVYGATREGKAQVYDQPDTTAPNNDDVDPLDDPKNTGVMVALFPDPEAAKKIMVRGGDDPDQLHVTLAYLGKTTDSAGDGLTLESATSKIVAAAQAAAATYQPLSGTVGGVGKFPDHGDGVPVIALVDVVGLGALREAVVDALEAQGLPVKTDHGFTPHMTLGYNLDLDLVPDSEPVPVEFSHLVVAVGGSHTRIPLGSDAGAEAVAGMVPGSASQGQAVAGEADEKSYNPTIETGPYAGHKSASSGSADPVESKGFPRLAGSLEERMSAISRALDDALLSNLPDEARKERFINVDGTWLDRVICTVNHWTGPGADECESFEFPYSVGDDGAVSLGEPTPVKLKLTAELDGAEIEDIPVGDLMPLTEFVEQAIAGIKTLGPVEIKAGRVLSGANAERLKTAVEHLISVLAAAGIEVGDPTDDSVSPTPDMETTAPAARGKSAVVPTQQDVAALLADIDSTIAG